MPHWLFAAATADATVFAIAAGRGTADAAARLDADFDGFLVRDGAAGEGSDHGVRVATGRLEAELERLLEPRYRSDENRRLANHLDREFPFLFAYLKCPGLEATNYRAEQAIRPAAVIRKVWGGNRTPTGASTQEILMSVLRMINDN